MFKFFLGTILFVSVCTTAAFASDSIRTIPPSPGCQIGKDEREICARAWDAYDYHHASTCQSSDRRGRELTCPMPRIYPRISVMLRSVVMDFYASANPAQDSVFIKVCVMGHEGDKKEYCSEESKLDRTQAIIERIQMAAIFREPGWGQYMYVKVIDRNARDEGGYTTPTSLQDRMIGYRISWLFDGSK